jgi:hypothetical protein
MTSTKDTQAGRDLTPKTSTGRPQGGLQSEASQDSSIENEEATVQDWIEAENSRPTLPDETADGLDDLDEEVRHQAEDLPLDTPGRS